MFNKDRINKKTIMKEIICICTLERTKKSSASRLDTIVCNPSFNRVNANKRRIVVQVVIIIFYEILLFYLFSYFIIMISQ